MSRPRTFDYDEATSLYVSGMTITEIARRFGVTWQAVQRAVVPGTKERMAAASSRFAQAHRQPCIEGCGRTVTYQAARYHKGRCKACASIARGSTAREGELLCAVCKEWKPDEDFPSNRREKFARRGRHTNCRACLTVKKREWRSRNQDKQRAYDRERKRRLRGMS